MILHLLVTIADLSHQLAQHQRSRATCRHVSVGVSSGNKIKFLSESLVIELKCLPVVK